MSYYHDLFERFNDCPVSVAFSDATIRRNISVVTTREFRSLRDAVDFTLDKQRDLESVVVTAHPATGDYTLSDSDLANLAALAQELRNCQD